VWPVFGHRDIPFQMPGTNRGRFNEAIVWGACGVALALFLFTLSAIAHLHGVQSESYKQRATQHSERAQTAASSACRSLPPERVVDCAYEEIKASNETQRAEDNLSAQQNIAIWTFATFMAAVVAIIISTGGLIALLRTVRQGQEANEIARTTARHELRAYVGLSEPAIEPYEWGNEKTGKITIVLRNVGQTPAFRSVTRISMAVAPYDRENPVIPQRWDRESARQPFDIQPGADLLRETRLPIDAILARWEEMEDQTDAIFVRVEITFSTIYEERFRQVTVFHSHGRRYREALPMNVTRQFAEEKVDE
jgi:hypothetical protein